MTDHTPAEEPTPNPPTPVREDGQAPLSPPVLDGAKGLLLIFTPSVQDPGFLRQKELLDDARDGLSAREMLVVEVIGPDLAAAGGQTVAAEEAARLRARWRAEPDVLTVVLAGADGTEKLRANQPMSAGPLFSVIDAGTPGAGTSETRGRN